MNDLITLRTRTGDRKPGWLSVKWVAKKLDVRAETVHALCRRGELRRAYVAGIWYVEPNSIAQYLKRQQRRPGPGSGRAA